jgi:hypothetical protein
LKAWELEYKEIFNVIEDIYQQTLEHVSKGEDQISKSLEDVFFNPLKPSAEEHERARLRKELGIPPGKKNDPIGDELSWEQLLTFRKNNKCEIWLISKDEDFYTLGASGYPVANSYLSKETDDDLPALKYFKDLPSAFESFRSSDFPDIILPNKELLDNVIKEQEKEDVVDRCEHTVEVIQNGRFDIYYCKKCGKIFGARHSDYGE